MREPQGTGGRGGRAYYNEVDPFCAAWLRNLIAAGLITPGDVDERSIVNVRPADVAGYDRCHFFAGIAGWELALDLAGWGTEPVWTGSCPCQPFSAAGRQVGFDDARHLWPVWSGLIRECRPAIIFGEQVASSAIVGRSLGADADVQALRDREAVFRVLRELQGSATGDLQDLRDRTGNGAQARQSSGHEGILQGLARGAPGARTGFGSSAPSSDQGAAVRSDDRRHPEAHRLGHLRDDGHFVRPECPEGMERAFAGSDHSWCWIHPEERARGALRLERDGQHLGAEPDRGDRGGNQGSAEDEERHFASEARYFAEEANQLVWLDAVFADLEKQGYACRAAVLGAHSVGAPHIRQRLWFVADAESSGLHEQRREDRRTNDPRGPSDTEQSADSSRNGSALADVLSPRLEGRDARSVGDECATAERGGAAGVLGDPTGGQQRGFRQPDPSFRRELSVRGSGPWGDAIWLPCRDGKARPTQPGLQPLVNGVPSRVGKLRAAGNAINPHAAAEFVAAYLDARPTP